MSISDSTTPNFDEHYANEQQRRSRHPLRRIVKSFYLNQILVDVTGPTIDFGCGAGQLLRRLPQGSIGLEVNPKLVESLKNDGLTVYQSNGSIEDFDLPFLSGAIFDTLTISHVLEHLPNPSEALKRLMAASDRLGVNRIVAVVPGWKGYQSDATHCTFIDRAYASKHFLGLSNNFEMSAISYFPGQSPMIGRYFTFHEMKLVFDRRTSTGK